jgi:YVTN family beta-propeller protein
MKTRHLKRLLGAILLVAGCSSADNYTKPAPTPTAPPKAYVGLFLDNAVGVIDTGTNKVTKTIPVPAGPHGLVVTPDGAKVYVSSDGASTVSVISTASDSVVASIDVGMTPHGLSISPDGRKVVCAGFGTDSVLVIDTGSDTVVTRVPVPRPHNSAISPDGKLAYVGSQQKDAPAVAVVDLAGGTVLTSVPLAHAPRALDFAPDGEVYFTVSGVDGLEALLPATHEVEDTPITTGGSPHHMLSTKDGKFELVVSQTAGDLEYVDVATDAVVAHVPTGKAPHWIGLNADGSRAYVTNESDNSVSVVDVAQRQVVASIPVGNGPRKIAVQPAGAPTGTAAVANIAVTNKFAFEPAHLTVAAGTVVRWTNKGAVPHTVTSGQSSRPADNPGAELDRPLASGAVVERTFTTPGDWAYFCRYHEGMGMAGVVTVTAAANDNGGGR